jgi:hypothetical protein
MADDRAVSDPLDEQFPLRERIVLTKAGTNEAMVIDTRGKTTWSLRKAYLRYLRTLDNGEICRPFRLHQSKKGELLLEYWICFSDHNYLELITDAEAARMLNLAGIEPPDDLIERLAAEPSPAPVGAAHPPAPHENQANNAEPAPAVVLGDEVERPIVLGKQKDRLTPVRRKVVKALLDAGENVLTGD